MSPETEREILRLTASRRKVEMAILIFAFLALLFALWLTVPILLHERERIERDKAFQIDREGRRQGTDIHSGWGP